VILLNDKEGSISYNKYGSMMELKKYIKHNDCLIYFPDFNWETHRSYKAFINGNIICPYDKSVLGVGYKGEGIYDSSECYLEIYRRWQKMLRRCYHPTALKRNPTYKDCFVCEEWHNYQNFAQWCEENYYEVPGSLMDLDKDILFKHNKEYCPDFCCFIPHEINSLFIKSDKVRGSLPIGVHQDGNKYIAQINKNGKRKYLGAYSTPEEAFNVYKEKKEELIKQIADEYAEYLPYEVYNAMCNYEVEIDD
jgi:hypothetical protein